MAAYLFRVDRARSLAAVDSLEKLLPGPQKVWFAGVLVQLGQHERAVRLVREVEAMAARQHVRGSTLARGYLAIGETQRALAMIERAFEERDPELIDLKLLPWWYDGVRNEPRLQAVRAKMHFPPDRPGGR
jgi:hypothetical protein